MAFAAAALVVLGLVLLALRRGGPAAAEPLPTPPSGKADPLPLPAPAATDARGTYEFVKNEAVAALVDPCVAAAIVKVESNAQPQAVNRSDPSYGLFQLMDGTEFSWRRWFNAENGTHFTTQDLFDAAVNTRIGLAVITYFLNRGFLFPANADIYNVGETLWARGVRNTEYRQRVLSAYSNCRRTGLP